MILPGLLAGLVFGGGALLVLRGVAPPRPPLARALAGLAPEHDDTGPGDRAGSAGDAARSARTAARILTAAGLDLGSHDPDLRVMGRTPEHHALTKLAAATGAAGGAAALLLAATAAGIAVPWPAAAPLALAAAGVGFLLPDPLLRDAARQRRREMAHTLSVYLELAVVVIAAGGGVETALHDAAVAGRGWAFGELRAALESARLAGRPPWRSLAALGRELRVAELEELAATMSLAGEQGARVRGSLAAKAESMRERQLAAVQADAEASTERMSIPTVVMLFGFLAFVLYPALRFVLGEA